MITQIETLEIATKRRVSFGYARPCPILQQIASDWGLKLNTARGLKIAKRILENSVRNN